MLSRLYIENIAVIKQAEINYTLGLNIMSGETGAGKSILIDSIMAVMGERTSRELIRTGAQNAYVSAEFTDLRPAALEALAQLGIEPDEGAVTLSREIKADGRGTCRINGRPVNVTALKTASRQLVNIHGQHDTQSLMDPLSHLRYLDAMTGDAGLFNEYQTAYTALVDARRRLRELEVDESEKERRIDMLRYQINDIESASIRPGETDRLMRRRDRCRNFEKIRSALGRASAILSGDEDTTGAVSMLDDCREELSSVSDVHSDYEALHGRIKDAYFEVADIAEELSAQLSAMEFDPAELEQIEDRLDVLGRIRKKYGGEEEALAYAENARHELENLVKADERREQLQQEVLRLKKTAAAAAIALSDQRRATAQSFSQRIREELSFLDMPGVGFEVSFEQKPMEKDGADRAEFLISANPGEPPKPIAKIASGGELSRIMLAIKNVLADSDDVDTLIFDEIDTGVSGRAAYKIGVKLKEASASRQIICITHLSQIAANADTHMLIKKQVADGRTFTQITELDIDGRIRELARINGGEDITETQLATARELLVQSGALAE